MGKLKKTVSFRLTIEDVLEFHGICKHNNLDKSFVIRNLIKQYNKKQKKIWKKLQK